MSINDIPLGRLKEILASDMPLTIVTTEALITRLEQAEAAVARVRELAEAWHVDSFVYDSNPLNGTLTINVSDASKHVARALDGDGRA